MDTGAEKYSAYRSGDDGAVGELVDIYFDGLMLYINSLVHDLALAEELAQDTFFKLITKKPAFHGRSSFKTWLYEIGRNVAADHMRRSARRRTVPLDESAGAAGDSDVEMNYIKSEENAELYRALMMLKPEYRQALWLAYFEDLSIREIALIMHRSESSVTHLINRGKYALRKEITDRRGNDDGK